MQNNKILICGAGAIGGYFGGRLALNFKNKVIFLARGNQYKNLRENGLRVKSIHGDFEISANVIDNPIFLESDFDFIFICVKLYDTDELIESIKDLLKSGSVIVTLQNGLYGFEKLKKYVNNPDLLVQGICRISSELKSDGIIYHSALGKILTGEFEGYGKTSSRKLFDLLVGSSVKSVLSDDFKREVWVKYAWNAIFNSLTAFYMMPADSLFKNEKSKDMVFRLYDSISKIALTQGVMFGEKEYKLIIIDTINLKDFFTSAYFDRKRGKKTEIPYLLSYLVKLAEENNLKDNFILEFAELAGMKN